MVCAAPDLQWRGSRPRGAIVGEAGTRSGPRAPQAQAILGTSALVRLPERGDEVALRIGPRGTRGLGEGRDRPRPRPGQPRGGRWGGTAVRGLASLRTAGDPRTVAVAVDLQGRPPPLRPRPAPGRTPRAGRDDRRGPRRTPCRPPPSGHQSARAVQARRRAGDAWPQALRRWEATTGSGAHAVGAGGRGPGGQRHEAPPRPPRNGRRGAVAPVGRPLATAGRAGARAAAGCSLAILARLRPGGPTPGRRGGGAGPRRALATRASRGGPRDGSWSPWPGTGAPAAAMDAWSRAGGAHGAGGRRAGQRPGRHGGGCALPGRPTTRERGGPNG